MSVGFETRRGAKMKLINKTKIPDTVIRDILMTAKKSLCKRIDSDIIIRVRFSKRGGGYIKNDLLRVRGKWNPKNPEKWIYPNYCVVMECSIPKNHYTDSIVSAKNFYETCQHEWGHIYDCQRENRGENIMFAKKINTRRTNHGLRIEEIRTEEYMKGAKDNGYECIMKLAIELENILPLN